MPVRATPKTPAGQTDLDVARPRRSDEIAQLERRSRRAGRVVLVGDRGAEDPVEIGALVAERQLQQVSAVAGQDLLRGADEVVERLNGIGVAIEVDPGKPQEQWIGRTQLGEELAASGAHALVNLRQDPGTNEPLVQRGWFDNVYRRDRLVEARHDAEGPAGVGVDPPVDDLHAVAKGRERRGIEHDLARPCQVLGIGKVVHERAREDVDQLDLRVADDEAPGAADRDGHLQCELDGRPAGGGDRADAGHRRLHREGRGGGPRPVVSVEPARDRVAREVDDVPAAAVQLVDDGVEDAAEVRDQLLRAALRTELGGERLGQGREAGDVGEQRGPGDAVGHRLVPGKGPPSVARDVRLGVVPIELDG